MLPSDHERRRRPALATEAPTPQPVLRFGPFQLDVAAGQLLKSGRVVRLKPQPLKLLHLLATRPDEVVTREDIRHLLWDAGTFVDFEQGVNTVVRQIRDALNDAADGPRFIETIPKQGYRFIAPVATGETETAASKPRLETDLALHKALWLNIAELRLAEVRRQKLRRIILAAVLLASALGLLAYFVVR